MAALLLATLAIPRGANAQAAATDTKGDGPILVHVGKSLGFLGINVAEKKAELSYLRRPSGDAWYYGVRMSAGVSNSIGSVLSTGDLVPAATAELLFGKVGILQSSSDRATNNIDWIDLSAAFDGQKIVRWLPDTTFDKQIQRSVFTGMSASARYNAFRGNDNGGRIWSVGFGYARENNAGELAAVEIKSETVRSDTAQATTRKAGRTIAAIQGDYAESDSWPVLFDMFVLPHKDEPVGVSVFARHVLSDGKPKTAFGAGIWMLHPEARSQARAGVVVQVDDVFDNYPSDATANLGKRVSVNLIIGVPLFFTR